MITEPAGPAGPPVPPPGPGVQVPFPAPPSERDRRRLWIGLGVGGALLAVCCVGGIFGVGALLVQTTREVLNQATGVVDTYLSAMRQGDYSRAYDQLCADLRGQMSRSGFADSQSARARIDTYTLDQPRAIGSDIWIQAEVARVDGTRETPDFKLVRDGGATAAFKICEITQ